MSIEKIQAQHAEASARLNDPETVDIVVPVGMRMEQLGLGIAMVDKLGRIWIEIEINHLTMIFDPSWLHPSKRWNGPRIEREVPKTRSPR
jgi:hypothetical protein